MRALHIFNSDEMQRGGSIYNKIKTMSFPNLLGHRKYLKNIKTIKYHSTNYRCFVVIGQITVGICGLKRFKTRGTHG
jgi:hypothetical protein